MAAFTTIDDPGAYFNPYMYVGDDTTPRALTGVGFQPDHTVIKCRDATDEYLVFDSVRGANKYLEWDDLTAEDTQTQTLISFDSDGYTVGDWGAVNGVAGHKQASWNWKAGTTTGIDTTGATITPSGYSFNQDAGFSIVAYTGNNTVGATLPHGLGAVPDLMIIKTVNTNEAWCVFHKNLDPTAPEDYHLQINTTASKIDNHGQWNDTMPTSTVCTFGGSSNVNTTYTYVGYFFKGIQGYSKFGIYTGNSNADGAFVYTGFRPAVIISKRASGSTGDWYIWDNKRNGFNVENNYLYMDTTGAEVSGNNFDILSNGFKCRDSANFNSSSYTHVYLAFAESPFVNSNGASANAR